MQLYFDLISQPSRALWMFLKLNQIPFEPVVVKLGRGEQKKASYKNVNRFQQVPCIVDKELKLSESVAMFRYIVAMNPNIPDHWYPKDLQERAKVDEYLAWQHTTLRSGCAGFVLARYLEPVLSWRGADEKKIEEKKTLMEKSLDQMENIWLSDPSKPFLATQEISFADIHAACELEQPKFANYDPFEGRPNLAKWHELVKEKTNPIYDEAHKPASTFYNTLNKSRAWKLWHFYFQYNY